MIPRIEAQEALHQVHIATLTSQYCDPAYRSGVMARWNALAWGKEPNHDGGGRAILKSGADLRRWLQLEGGFGAEIQA